MTDARRVIGYVRVSTAEQKKNGAGLAAQSRAIREECARRGWTLVRIESEALSGKDTKRPRLAAAIESVSKRDRQRRDADTLMVAKLDRLSRSLLDFTTLSEQSRAQRWAIVALDIGVDTSTPVGEMAVNILAVFAQFERRIISQRTSEGMQEKKLQGHRFGRESTLPGEVIERIVLERAAGASYREVAAGLNGDGVPCGQGGSQWYAATVRGVALRAAAAA